MPATLLMGLGLTGCDTTPTNSELLTGPNFAAVPNPQFTSFNISISNCLETVDVTGTFRSVSRVFESENGNLVLEFHLVAKGIGIGSITGDTYEWNDNLFSIRIEVPEGTRTFILRESTRLIGRGSAVNSQLRLQFILVINPDGEVIIDSLTVLDSDCKIID